MSTYTEKSEKKILRILFNSRYIQKVNFHSMQINYKLISLKQ